MEKPVLFCATSNAGKLREFRSAAAGSLTIETLPGLADIRVPEETGNTFEANAILKAVYYGGFTDGMILAEDSGLEVEALGGAPGVYSARFAGAGATDETNNSLLLEKLQGVTDRRARYVCVIALARRGVMIGTYCATVEGEILTERRGNNGFGYDPLFYYPPFGCTFGEASMEKKQTVSHRGEAVRQMIGCLNAREC